ncbi:MAG: MopE-related protein [Myxococcota bacterium]|nr:MopE-related protein [Myxococcota bacterium]
MRTPVLRLASLLVLGLLWSCGVVEDDPDGGKRLCSPDDAEVCNFEDDDCDGEVDEDFRAAAGASPALGEPCDGLDQDLCREGVFTCTPDGRGVACSDLSANTAELCNALDDDCDGEVDEDFQVGVGCDSPDDDDLCEDDVTECSTSGGRIVCRNVANDHSERCNGVDDDCDGVTDNGFNVGQACDGPDTDFCSEGVLACNGAGDGTTCSDATGNTVETCNGLDDDCDGTEDDGFDVGSPCDGADSDVCIEGVKICRGDGTGTQCNDTTSSTPELCNGLDDDCDGLADEDWNIGDPCDGQDTDSCQEGVWSCNGASARQCAEPPGDQVETCNGGDDDCDGLIDEDGACCNGAVCNDDLGETCANCPSDCGVCP